MLAPMAYGTVEARQEMLDLVARAVDDLGYALAELGAAYEMLDEASADRLEEDLFGPVQVAYGRAKRVHSGFAQRHGLPPGEFPAQEAGVPSTGARGFIDAAVAAVGRAGIALSELQDSPEVLEVGDVELRTGVADVRSLLGPLPGAARELTRRLGR
jgi:hypothetical protein